MFLFNYPSILLFALLSIIIFYLISMNRKKIPIAIFPRTLKISAESNLVGIKHDSDVIIDCECNFDNLECKNLVITKNGRLKVFNISAENLYVGGEVSGASMISIKNIIKILAWPQFAFFPEQFCQMFPKIGLLISGRKFFRNYLKIIK